MKIKILLSIISVLFVTVLFLLYLNFTKPTGIIDQLPTPTSLPISSVLSLKHYSNSQFEFNYPNGFILTEEQNLITIHTNSNNDILFATSVSVPGTITEYLAKADKESSTSWEGKSSVNIESTKKTVINGLNCVQRTEHLLAADITQTSTYFKSGSTVVSIILRSVPGNSLTEDIPIYSQILSTFKFNENSTTQTIKVYFHNSALDPNFENAIANDFKLVTIPKTNTPLKDAINELIKFFVTEDENAYGTRVLNFKLKSASINNGVAKLVFEDPENYTSGGSTRVNLIYSQIEKTALQFPTVKKVEITGAVFQP